MAVAAGCLEETTTVVAEVVVVVRVVVVVVRVVRVVRVVNVEVVSMVEESMGESSSSAMMPSS
ncbi:hypothetical protein HDU96_002352 [Phlyctochytrium bullatum]|nr:hypothetical protein HDU96_002352 [Phlyctochytrium bullatum]